MDSRNVNVRLNCLRGKFVKLVGAKRVKVSLTKKNHFILKELNVDELNSATQIAQSFMELNTCADMPSVSIVNRPANMWNKSSRFDSALRF